MAKQSTKRSVHWRPFFASSASVEAPSKRVNATVHERYALVPDTRIDGPALVEEHEATVFIPPSWSATVQASGDLIAGPVR